MSEYVPLEIQVEIIKRLPVKTLLQFRSVSKQWKALIDGSEFIDGYRVLPQSHPQQQQRLLVWYNVVDTKEKYVWFVDDDGAFSQQKLAPTIPLLSKFSNNLRIVGSSQGLLCFYGYYQDPGNPRYKFAKEMAVIWNPCIRKSVCIPVPGMFCEGTVVGFGVCPITNDPTIVKISNLSVYFGTVDDSPMVEVFTLSRGSWRIPSGILPKKSILVTWSQVVIDSHIYWAAIDMDDEVRIQKNLIVSFDMSSQEFRVINLPDSLAYQSISKVCDSLAVLDYIHYSDFEVCTVWIMDHTVPNSFTELFTINKQCDILKILGFTKRGEPIMETQDNYDKPAALVVYEPSSENINDTGIYGKNGLFFISSYMETLLLLDQLDCSVLF